MHQDLQDLGNLVDLQDLEYQRYLHQPRPVDPRDLEHPHLLDPVDLQRMNPVDRPGLVVREDRHQKFLGILGNHVDPVNHRHLEVRHLYQ
jgi:hypothetical protein